MVKTYEINVYSQVEDEKKFSRANIDEKENCYAVAMLGTIWVTAKSWRKIERAAKKHGGITQFLEDLAESLPEIEELIYEEE
ncbi:MAG: hypothetical protein ACTSYF_03385 [Promethearchaeota archaeon]